MNRVEHLVICLKAICISFSKNFLLLPIAHLKKSDCWSFSSLLLEAWYLLGALVVCLCLWYVLQIYLPSLPFVLYFTSASVF